MIPLFPLSHRMGEGRGEGKPLPPIYFAGTELVTTFTFEFSCLNAERNSQ